MLKHFLQGFAQRETFETVRLELPRCVFHVFSLTYTTYQLFHAAAQVLYLEGGSLAAAAVTDGLSY